MSCRPCHALFLALFAVLPLSASCACAELKQGENVPDGITCTDHVFGGADGDSLRKALATAKPGDCVIVGASTYKGSFEVPQGVTIASGKGQRATIQGTVKEKAAIAITGGNGSGLCGLSVVDSVGIGISVKGGPVIIKDVSIEKALDTGLATRCDDCGSEQAIELRDVRISKSKIGAWFRGGVVKWTGGKSTQNMATSLTGGAGVIADSVSLDMSNVAVEDNQFVGLLFDGTRGATGKFGNVRVSGNGERGFWAQHLKPKAEGEDSLVVHSKSAFVGNGQVGLGFVDAIGVRVSDTTIQGTVEKPVVVGLQSVEVGDGLVFDSSAGVIENVTMKDNARAAAIIDRPPAKVQLSAVAVTAAAGGHKIVVQRDDSKKADVPADAREPDLGKVLVVPPVVELNAYGQ